METHVREAAAMLTLRELREHGKSWGQITSDIAFVGSAVELCETLDDGVLPGRARYEELNEFTVRARPTKTT